MNTSGSLRPSPATSFTGTCWVLSALLKGKNLLAIKRSFKLPSLAWSGPCLCVLSNASRLPPGPSLSLPEADWLFTDSVVT